VKWQLGNVAEERRRIAPACTAVVEIEVANWRNIAITLIMALRGALECNGLFSTVTLSRQPGGTSRLLPTLASAC
jgi:hypothetical protein